MDKAVVEAVAGGIGTLVASCATYPLKTIYTLQAIRAMKDGARQAGAEGTPETDAALKSVAASPLAALCALCRAQLGLSRAELAAAYAGLGPSAVESVASNIIYFYLYSLLRQAAVRLARRGDGKAAGGGDQIGVAASLLVAALAGAGNMLVTTPAQVVSTTMMANAQARQRLERAGRPAGHVRCSTLGVCREVWDQDGPGGFWRGLLPSLILVVNPAVQYALFEAGMARAAAAKARRAARRPNLRDGRLLAPRGAKLGPGEVFLIGALAKIGATIVTYPMIVVKSRLQVTNEHTADANRYGGTSDAVSRIWREEGAPGFYAGLRAKILQTAVSAGLMLALKDSIASATEHGLRGAAAARAAKAAR
ncbi:MAG: mitochondrial carrier domain-containing protein [Monoraphidium minutum]|nr:MAG: mitochondrial carrier domain-containing protein [Monoraphidium minutum]